MRDARKMFRLGKSLHEIHALRDLVKEKHDTKTILKIMTRAFNIFYWIYDNLTILSKTKVLPALDTKQVAWYSNAFWLLGMIPTLILACINLTEAMKAEAKLLQEKPEDATEQMKVIAKKKFDAILVIIKTLGDMVVAANAIDLIENTVGYKCNDG